MSERKSKRLSGAQYRSRKLVLETTNKQLSGSLANYLKPCSSNQVADEGEISTDITELPNSSKAQEQKSNDVNSDEPVPKKKKNRLDGGLGKSVAAGRDVEPIEPNYERKADDVHEKNYQQRNIDANVTNGSRLNESLEDFVAIASAVEPRVKPNFDTEEDHHVHANDEQENVDVSVIGNDPAAWPTIITHDNRQRIIEKGPVRVKDFTFPKNDSGRSFTVPNYKRTLPNGEQLDHNWLVYSKKGDLVYCFSCKLFNNPDSSFGTHGFCDWKNLSRALSQHESSRKHLMQHEEWVEFRQRLDKNITIDAAQQRILQAEKKHWLKVLTWIIEIIKYLSKQCLAFRGSSETLYQADNGIFLKLVEMVGKFDGDVGEHLRRVETKMGLEREKLQAHYLGKNIQNELIELISRRVKATIVSMCQTAKYYTIILDCTPDNSHTEQISNIIRFVSCQLDQAVQIQERFLGFVPIYDTTGEGLTDFLLKELIRLNISIQNQVRGMTMAQKCVESMQPSRTEFET